MSRNNAEGWTQEQIAEIGNAFRDIYNGLLVSLGDFVKTVGEAYLKHERAKEKWQKRQAFRHQLYLKNKKRRKHGKRY